MWLYCALESKTGKKDKAEKRMQGPEVLKQVRGTEEKQSRCIIVASSSLIERLTLISGCLT